MPSGSIYSVNTDTLLSTEVVGGENFVLSTDTQRRLWYATRSGTTVTVSFRLDATPTEVGTFTSIAEGSDLQLHSVPMNSADGGIYLLEVQAGASNATKLRSISASTITLVGTVTTTGYETGYVGGLTYAPDGDLVFVGDNGSSESHLFKINPATAGLRAGYPSRLTDATLAGRRGRGCLQLGPSGYIYVFYQDGASAEYIGRCLASTGGVSGFAQVFNTSDSVGSSARVVGYTVLTGGIILGTISATEGGAPWFFYYDGADATFSQWTDFVPAGFDPFYLNDDTAPAIWQTATAVYFAGRTESQGAIASFTRAGVFQAVTVSSANTEFMGNSYIGNNADQDRYQYDNVVEPQLGEAPPVPAPEADIWYIMAQADFGSATSVPPYVFGIDKATEDSDVVFTGSNGHAVITFARDFDENTFFATWDTGTTLTVRYIDGSGLVSGSIGTIPGYSSANAAFAVGDPDGDGCWVLVRRRSGGTQANLYHVTTSGVTLLSSLVVTNHDAPVGLSWNADGDLVTMAQETLGGSAYRWSVLKVNPADGALRSGFPLAWPVQSANQPESAAAICLRSNGQLYCTMTLPSGGTMYRFAVDQTGFTVSPVAIALPLGATNVIGSSFSLNTDGDILYVPAIAAGPYLHDGSTWNELSSDYNDEYDPATGTGDQFTPGSARGTGFSDLGPGIFVGTVSSSDKWCVLGFSRRFYGPCLRMYDADGSVFATIPFNRTGAGTALQASEIQTVNPERGAWGGGDVTITAEPYDSSSGTNYEDLMIGDVALAMTSVGAVQIYGVISSESYSAPTVTFAVTPTFYVTTPTPRVSFGAGAYGFASIQRNSPGNIDPDGYALSMVRTAQGI
jgi:hypothetical protein